MQTLTQIKEMLERRGLAPRHALGQNFLIDQNLVRKLVEASGVGPGDVVLEIGPGTGVLTESLLARGCHVVAGELDPGLCDLLQDRFGADPRFTLVPGDCLASKHALAPALGAALGDRPFTLVANLPYNVATPVLATLLADHPRCRGMYVTIQRELADRLLAGPGSRDYGPLSILVRAVGDARPIAHLPPECFWPRPAVTSTMLAIARRARPLCAEPARLGAFAQRLFASRRKQIGSVLGRDVPWPPGIAPTRRAEELGVEQVIALGAATGAL